MTRVKWIPAFPLRQGFEGRTDAGMTEEGAGMTDGGTRMTEEGAEMTACHLDSFFVIPTVALPSYAKASEGSARGIYAIRLLF